MQRGTRQEYRDKMKDVLTAIYKLEDAQDAYTRTIDQLTTLKGQIQKLGEDFDKARAELEQFIERGK